MRGNMVSSQRCRVSRGVSALPLGTPTYKSETSHFHRILMATLVGRVPKGPRPLKPDIFCAPELLIRHLDSPKKGVAKWLILP